MTQTHILTTSKRTHRVTITELPDRIAITIRATRYGILGDEAQFQAWLWPILSRFDSDPRPVTMGNPHTKEQAVVGNGLAIVLKP